MAMLGDQVPGPKSGKVPTNPPREAALQSPQTVALLAKRHLVLHRQGVLLVALPVALASGSTSHWLDSPRHGVARHPDQGMGDKAPRS